MKVSAGTWFFFWDVPGASWYCALKPSGSTRGVMVLKWLSCFINKEIINEISFFRIWLFMNDYDLITIWNIMLLYQENMCKIILTSLIEKNVLANFLNGPISKKSFLISKIFNNKVMVIIFILIGIYHLYLNMSLIKHNKIHFSFLCKFFKNTFFSNSRILMLDKNR